MSIYEELKSKLNDLKGLISSEIETIDSEAVEYFHQLTYTEQRAFLIDLHITDNLYYDMLYDIVKMEERDENNKQ